ncbi:antibiotic biosynthesis monooxygenase [Spirosoma pomorum]
MYARIIQVSLQADAITEATDYFKNSVGPALKDQTGFLNSRFLVNSDTNKCLMVTLWESPEARTGAESNGFLQDVLKNMKQYFAEQPVIDYYDVAVQVA